MNLPLRYWLLVPRRRSPSTSLSPRRGRVSCISVRDYDKRQACLAEERRSPETCTSIGDADERALCRRRAGERDQGRLRR